MKSQPRQLTRRVMHRYLAAVVIPAMLLISVPAAAGAGGGPSAREGATMAYDAARGQLVLFGGATASGLADDTWVWAGVGQSGLKWKRSHPASSPPARTNAVMAYDAGRERVVLFGGLGASGLLGDTWTWDGQTWRQQSSTLSPSARYGATMVYDAARGNVVLFGGKAQITAGNQGDVNDTWVWNGSAWSPVAAAGPPPRHFAAMAYHAVIEGTVLFGGSDDRGFLRDTWVFDGVAWRSGLFPGPSERERASVAYDADCFGACVMMFGGFGHMDDDGVPERLDDQWMFSGHRPGDGHWGFLPEPIVPAARYGAAMATHDPSGTIVLFGGSGDSGLLGDTWTWDISAAPSPGWVQQ